MQHPVPPILMRKKVTKQKLLEIAELKGGCNSMKYKDMTLSRYLLFLGSPLVYTGV